MRHPVRRARRAAHVLAVCVGSGWRFVAIALAFLAAPASAEPSAPGRVDFEVLRGGQPFGRQSVVVTRANGQLIAQTSADLRATLGPVTLFHYTQSCREVWISGRLQHLTCSTTKGGRRTQVSATVNGDAILVEGRSGQIRLPAETLPTSWWTKPPTNIREMINTETGTRLPVRVTSLGRETITAGGARIQAEHIRVQGSLTVDLWYDDAGRWVGCAFTASGQHMTYRLLSQRSEGPA